MSDVTQLPDLLPVVPEIIMAIGAMVLLMIGAFGGRDVSYAVFGGAMGLLGTAFLILLFVPAYGETFGGSFVLDDFAYLMKLLVLAGSFFAIAMSWAYAKSQSFDHFEYPILIVLATLGLMLMLSANDMIALYLGLELQSLALYVVAAINRDSVRSTEAGLKYFVLGALSSGMLLYGMSLVYGFTGQISFAGIADVLAHQEASIGLLIGLTFILAGLAFKISAVPFHMWTPDVYEGAPTPVTAFLAAAPKVAAMGVLVRIVIDAFQPVTGDWQQIVVFISIASMALGSFAAIGQRNLKRLMAYSSIGHMGFALVGLAAGTEAGVAGVVFYMMAYLGMILGVFACILSMRRKDGMVEDVDDLAGLSQTNPSMAVLLGVLMFSFAGIPPMIGFFGKWYAFSAAVEAGLFPLAIVAVLMSVVAAFYYLRVIKVMFFDEPVEGFEAMPAELKVVLGVSSVFVFLFWLAPGPVVNAASVAAQSLF